MEKLLRLYVVWDIELRKSSVKDNVEVKIMWKQKMMWSENNVE